MRVLWAQVLNKSPCDISTEDNFFHIGGDVIKAMKLCREGPSHGLFFTVKDVFQNPLLLDLSGSANPNHEREVRTYAARSCSVQESQVVDVLPCTPLQGGLLALTTRRARDYVSTNVFQIREEVDIEKLRRAWDQVVAENPILRTRIISLPRQGLVQVVIEEGVSWEFATDINGYQQEDTQSGPAMNLGTPLTRFVVCDDGQREHRYFLWEIHHALYDGWSIPLLLNQVEGAYYNQSTKELQSIAPFIKYIADMDETATKMFWQTQFADLNGSHFPLPKSGYHPRPDRHMSVTVSNLELGHRDFTASTVLRAAWAIVVAQSAGSTEALLGVTVTGRQAAVADIESMAGPTIATVPVRVILDLDNSVDHLLEIIQRQAAEMIPFEQTGLNLIARMSEAAAVACDFQSLLVVQPEDQTGESSGGLFVSEPEQGPNASRSQGFSTYAIVVECQLEQDGVHIRFGFDSSIIGHDHMEHLIKNLEAILIQLAAAARGKDKLGLVVAETQIPWGLGKIWAWNASVPKPTERCVHDLITQQVCEHPSAPAVCSWDGSLTYTELDHLSTKLAHHLVYKGVAGTVVPLFFEKSVWMPVAILAVMKAGGASVAMDVNQPEQRLRLMSAMADSPLILSSMQSNGLVQRLGHNAVEVMIVGPNQDCFKSPELTLPAVSPSSLLYVASTSGSSGTPKGAMISHRNFCTAITHQQKALGFLDTSRVFEFASFAFDAAWYTLLFTLTSGGCLCIPSSMERENDLAGCLERYGVTVVDLTPSVARSLGPVALSRLSTLILGGEAVLSSDASIAGNTTQIMNVYGPAECTPTSTFAEVNSGNTRIGHGAGVCTWVVEPNNPELLAPLGAVGELWLEGPLLGPGYLNEPEKTAEAFLQDPKWLLRGASGFPGRRGRVYRTGDMVQYLEDGSLVFVGRKDTQVKIRGQRVELGEVEHHVHQAIEKAEGSTIANVHGVAETIQPQGVQSAVLLAFIALDFVGVDVTEKMQSIAIQQVTAGLADRLASVLPAYMVPTSFIPVQRIPVTATGKTDRRQLRTMGAPVWLHYRDVSNTDKKAEDLTDVELILQQVWMSVLNLSAEEVSVNKAFTRIGGDSISAMQVVSRCRLHNIAITVSDVLQAGTIRKLATCCRLTSQNTSAEEDQLETQDETTQAFDLSPIQKMFFDAYSDGLNHFNQSFVLELSEEISRAALNAALGALVSRHSMLRARFQKGPDSGLWRQKLALDDEYSFGFTEHIVSNRSQLVQAAQWRQEHLDIRDGPVFACDFGHVPGGQILVLSAHHLVVDLVSWRIIWNDIEEYLRFGELRSQPTTSFQTWCKRQDKITRNASPLAVLPYAISEPQLDFWGLDFSKNTFGSCETYTEVFDHEVTNHLFGASNDSLRTEPVDILLGAMVHAFTATFPERVTPVVWVEGHGREQSDDLPLDISATVGWFTTIHPLPITIQPGCSVIDAIRLAKDTRRKVPGNGRPYFACRYLSESGREHFRGHETTELVFNFTGRYQQMESDKSMFKRLQYMDEEPCDLVEVSPLARRLSLIEVNADIEDGLLAVSFMVHEDMRYQDRLKLWYETFAQTVRSVTKDLLHAPASFTLSDLPLLPISYNGLDVLLKDQLPSIGVNSDAIIDMYPCSPLQEGILLSSEKGSASYGTYSVWRCMTSGTTMVDPYRLEGAWRTVVSRHTILSTVFGLHPEGNGFIQIVLRKSNIRVMHMTPEHNPTLELMSVERPTFTASEPEHAFTICQSSNGEVSCRLDISHALIDAASISILVQGITAAYDDCNMPAAPPFSKMIEYINNVPKAERIASWTNFLDGIESCEIPLSSPHNPLRCDSYSDVSIPAKMLSGVTDFCKRIGITRSVFIQVSWAMVLAHFTGMRDVCFGYLASERDALVDGIETMVGPLANLLISRIDLRAPARQVLETAFQNSIKLLAIRHISLAEIQHGIGHSGRRLFNTSVSIRDADHPIAKEKHSLSFESHIAEDLHEYDLSLSATLGKVDIDIVVEFREPHVTRQLGQEVCTVLAKAIDYLLVAGTQQCADHLGNTLREEPGFDIGVAPVSLFDGFFASIVGIDEASTANFWEKMFSKIQGCHFPSPKSNIHHPRPDDEITLSRRGLNWSASEFEPSTIIKASWAIVAARMLSSNEAVFGATVSDQQTVVPLCVPLDWDSSVKKLLQSVDNQNAEMAPFIHTGLQRIRLISNEAALACDFQTLLHIVTKPSSDIEAEEPVLISNEHKSYERFNSNALVLVCNLQADELIVCIKFDSNVVGERHATRLGHQFQHVLDQLSQLGTETKAIRDVTVASNRDLNDIWKWNKTVPEPVDACVHGLITARVLEQPSALAIHAWDGDLTYGQLNNLSTNLAHVLIEKGIGRGAIVPLCFEKSMWMPVAAIAVMMAGATSVAVDTSTQLEERLRAITTQVHARVILSSVGNEALVRRLGTDDVLVVGPDQLPARISDQHSELPTVTSSDSLYAIFTSGSTGEPKGAIISHGNFCSAISYQRDELGFTKTSRVLDFSSYAFDVAWSNLLNTLTAGGTLCVPSAAERENDISACIEKYSITMMDLTPSVASHIEPKTALSSLSTLILGGEIVLATDRRLAGDDAQVKSAYGPAECTPTSMITELSETNGGGLGYGAGLCTWVVEADNPEQLAAIGAIGELWLEGPLVGQGYISGSTLTSASFIENPQWLLRGLPSTQHGRHGRLYRTGDLVQYTEDGSLLFIGRKDRQVKIHGQRVELGEVEQHVRQVIDAPEGKSTVRIVAEPVQLHGNKSVVLAAFVAVSGTGDSLSEEDHARMVRQATSGTAERLAALLPPYMIPKLYIPIQTVPMTATGKIDRRRLRQIGSSLTTGDIAALAQSDGEGLPPQSEMERAMQGLWADALSMDPDTITRDSSFFRIGGDSIRAMRLVGIARQKGYCLTVREIFKSPVLRDLACKVVVS
ncbi:non-ribosomal peptide synthetase [Ilyonectria robusta]|uniref:non-ribosomal peptide synthetase n=1 Tax=Ilyonectria robusta TaxID=1079257 RepID=UPI001E8EE321|nr:non-ribosomal peptide synthetase [Ilyonectria robusta]KAH8672362.1 non-ribosomal peptide synthetase [Ilyonectria robusta]